MKISKTIDIWMMKSGYPPRIDCTQYDSGLEIVANFRDFTIPTGATARLYIEKPSKKFVYQSCTVKSSTQIVIQVDSQGLAEYGVAYGQIRITSSETLSTFDIEFKVKKSRADLQAVESKNVVSAFDELAAEILSKLGIDDTLSKKGLAADAKAVGDAIGNTIKIGDSFSGTGPQTLIHENGEEVELVTREGFEKMGNNVFQLSESMTKFYLGKRDTINGTQQSKTLSDYLCTGIYGIRGGSILTDAPDNLTFNDGVTLYVYNGTGAGGVYVTQMLVRGNNKEIWSRVLNANGSVALQWQKGVSGAISYIKNLSGTIALSSYLDDGWYSIAGSSVVSDLPSEANIDSGLTLFVFEKTHASGGYITQFLMQGADKIWCRIFKTNHELVVDWKIIANIDGTLSYKQIIPKTATKLSDYRKNGWYGLAGMVSTSDMPNGAKTNSASTLFVFEKTAANSEYITQIFQQGNPRRTWIRTINNNGSDISGFEWEELTSASMTPAYGKTATFYGDSTVIGQGGNGINFAQICAKNLKLNYENKAVSGRSISTHKLEPTPMVSAYSTEITLKDLLYLQGGTNDFWTSAPIGTIDSTNKSTFYGALNVMVSDLQTKFPSMRIILGTPFRLKYNGSMKFNRINKAGYTLEDYCDAIKAIGKKYCVPVIDNYNNTGFDPNNSVMYNFYMSDDVHMNENGYKRIGAWITSQIASLF